MSSSQNTETIRKPVSIADIYFRSKELERKGVDIIHLDVGEPDFEPPQEVTKATKKAIDESKGRYTAAAGIFGVRTSIAERLNSKYKTSLSPDQVVFTSGGRLALYLAFFSLPKAAKVAIFTPDWPAYRDVCNIMGFDPIFISTSLENSWTPDPAELEAKDFDALVLNYPNNPTGKVVDADLLDWIIRIATEKNAAVISDEVYSDYLFNSENRFESILQSKEKNRFALASSLSKSYAMTGYRAGYVVSDKETAANFERINGIILSSAPEFVQYAAIAALDCDNYVADKVNLIRKRKEAAVRALCQSGYSDFYEPDGSLYIFPRIRNTKGKTIDSEVLALDLLDKVHVSVTPGTVFGSQFRDYIRITLLQDEERIARGIELIGDYLER